MVITTPQPLRPRGPTRFSNGPARMSPVWVSQGEVSHWCEWCGCRCGRYDESVVAVPLVHKATGVERTWVLCPPCACVPALATVRLWAAWRRDFAAMRERAGELAEVCADADRPEDTAPLRPRDESTCWSRGRRSG